MNQHRPLPLLVLDPHAHACSYLPTRSARHEYLIADNLSSRDYQSLMDQRFRRSGAWVYRPACEGCAECVPLRVRADRFTLSRSQRRAIAKNKNVIVHMGPPESSDEKWQLYRKYLAIQHGSPADEDRASFEQFLFKSPIDTLEMTYRLAGELIGVGIIDLCPDALSSVYFYFEPAESRRSLGVFSAIREIEECRRMGKNYWYAGYYVRESPKMNYKSRFKPCEFLIDGRWQESNPGSSQGPHQHNTQHEQNCEDI
jgi:arginyl-tRNA--protein-N-Asp/Glu arginylyltransferase